jgi:hypothetical protein
VSPTLTGVQRMNKKSLVDHLVDKWAPNICTDDELVVTVDDRFVKKFDTAYIENPFKLYRIPNGSNFKTIMKNTGDRMFPLVWYAIHDAVGRQHSKVVQRHKKSSVGRHVPRLGRADQICKDNYFQLEPGGPCWSVEQLAAEWDCINDSSTCQNTTSKLTSREKDALLSIFMSVSVKIEPESPDSSDSNIPKITSQIFQKVRVGCMDRMADNLQNVWEALGMNSEFDSCTKDPEKLDEMIQKLQEYSKSKTVWVRLQNALSSGIHTIMSAGQKSLSVLKTMFNILYTLSKWILRGVLKLLLMPVEIFKWVKGASGRFLEFVLGEKQYAKLKSFILRCDKSTKAKTVLEHIWKLLSPVRTIVWWILSNPVLVRMILILTKTIRNAIFNHIGKFMATVPKFRGDILPTMILQCRSCPTEGNNCVYDRCPLPTKYREFGAMLEYTESRVGHYKDVLQSRSESTNVPADFEDELDEQMDQILEAWQHKKDAYTNLVWSTLFDQDLMLFVFGASTMTFFNAKYDLSNQIYTKLYNATELALSSTMGILSTVIPAGTGLWPILSSMIKMSYDGLEKELDKVTKSIPSMMLSAANLREFPLFLDWSEQKEYIITSFIEGYLNQLEPERQSRQSRIQKRMYSNQTRTTWRSMYGQIDTDDSNSYLTRVSRWFSSTTPTASRKPMTRTSATNNSNTTINNTIPTNTSRTSVINETGNQ